MSAPHAAPIDLARCACGTYARLDCAGRCPGCADDASLAELADLIAARQGLDLDAIDADPESFFVDNQTSR